MGSRRWLLYFSITASLIYLASTPWHPFPGSPEIKGCAVGALALLALQFRGEKRDAVLLAVGLAFSTAGDVLLDLDPQLFVFGLGAFLMAHLTYIALFARNRTQPFRPSPSRWAAVALVVAYAATLSSWIVPSVGPLAVPVVFYICAITTMVSTAILADFRERWVAIGAVLFLISDSVLAINKFKITVPARDYLVGITYYLGQCGIALGVLASVSKLLPARELRRTASV
jgi:uncharacterized membrane protein YhhN